MKALRSVAFGTTAVLVGSLVVACSGSDGSGGEEPVWTSATSQGLACQSEGFYPNGVRPEGCPIIKPPPPPAPVTPCPTGYTCSIEATTMPAPVSGCTTPGIFSQTAVSGGVIAADYLVATCPTTPAVTAWIAANPTFHASENNTVPTLPAAPAGSTYLEYVPAPTAFPSNGVDGGVTDSDQFPIGLPCTDFFDLPPMPLQQSYEASYCLDLPSVEAWLATNYPGGKNGIESAGEGASVGDGFPTAPPGYIYLTLSSPKRVVIGGMCQRGCGLY